MALFERSDVEIIRSLLADGMLFDTVANKWGVSRAQLIRFCARNKISYSTKTEELSFIEKEVVKLHKSAAIDVIAKHVGRSERTVRRIIQKKCRDTYINRCKERVSAVHQLAESQNLTYRASCEKLGITYGSFDYARRIVNSNSHRRT